MIFEKLEYQQECIDNILELLETFDLNPLKQNSQMPIMAK